MVHKAQPHQSVRSPFQIRAMTQMRLLDLQQCPHHGYMKVLLDESVGLQHAETGLIDEP